MVALQIRNVPEGVRSALALEAERRGQSLQAYLLAVVTDEARRASNPFILNRIPMQARGMQEADEGAESSAVEILREVREQRTAHLLDVVGRRPDGP
ncbi:plasmid stability protein [Kineosphaera limosa]|uniref:Antitoxin FitA-like ribbon-helix-helix domain-containing protein n=1 Tax=Kineosphaera limosa NBRC 100340 TaxID=1184609 RepID=K6XGL1_9MICO|nr:hypothetical protein [Kineosphaera limosa]NYD99073.1 plasmid stability protein [Kineosphaera limosa]GAB97974.1 hypothetical protein KILIM_092_00070 [Kineosphaera limosa NBRC 100340]